MTNTHLDIHPSSSSLFPAEVKSNPPSSFPSLMRRSSLHKSDLKLGFQLCPSVSCSIGPMLMLLFLLQTFLKETEQKTRKKRSPRSPPAQLQCTTDCLHGSRPGGKGCERSVKIKLKIEKTYFENKSNTMILRS